MLAAKEAAKYLADLLLDDASEVRAAAARTLATLGSRDNAPTLIALLEDPSPRVR
jgi:HEAT repeat protein